MVRVQIYIVDAFTDRPFAGNPAAVCVLDGDRPETAWMQKVAAELTLPATAFVSRGQPEAQLQWFSASAELELCGHGTLASTHVLGELGGAGPFTFRTRSGVLRAERESTGEIVLDFPADHPAPAEVTPELVKAVGVEPVAAARGQLDTLVELDNASAVHAARPDLHAVVALGGRGMIVTAPGDDGTDFVSRFFAPSVGIGEDPVTGSAHCTLGPYWAARLGRTTLRGHQVSARGGHVGVEVRGDRVLLRGRAVTVVRGELA